MQESVVDAQPHVLPRQVTAEVSLDAEQLVPADTLAVVLAAAADDVTEREQRRDALLLRLEVARARRRRRRTL